MAQEAAMLRVERRLAAILAADVVGYSRLMGADEEGTLARLKAHRRELVDPTIKQHRGRVVKTTGHGMLVEFASPVEAVRCAVEVQRGMVNRNADVPPDKCIIFRTGIDLGDVIAEWGNLFGDGVNIAARLETVCKPGGMAISRSVREQIKDRLPFAFEDVGEHEVNNITRPIRVYGLSAEVVALLPLHIQAFEGSADAWHAIGPIVPTTGVDADRALIDHADATVAVMLDLVQPIRTPRGLAHRGRDGRRDPCRGKIEEAGLPEN
jgi:adenylate cyclase